MRLNRCWMLALVGLLGCGRLGFDGLPEGQGDLRPVGDAPDQDPFEDMPTDADSGASMGPGDASAPDPAEDAGPPTSFELALEPFLHVRALAALNTANTEDDPTATADLLRLVFARTEADGNENLWGARRSSTAEDLGAVGPLTNLNSDQRDTAPWLAPDGLRITFVSYRSGSPRHMVSTRPDRDALWAPPVELQGVSQSAGGGRLSETADGTRRVFRLSNEEGGDIAESVRLPDGTWSEPRVLEVNSDAADGDPYLDPAGLILVFRSAREGGPGDMDLYMAYRPDVDALFETPVLIPGVNTAGRESDPWLSADQQTLYFTREGELFEARR